ncbi:MAG: hypothetical protein J2O46_02425 [Nocardioides sp.]|nr:hypothetical protein [Nocardioides sp.]
MRHLKMLLAVVTAAVLSASLTSCTQLGTRAPRVASTFTFGVAGAPTSFDPFYGSDGDTFRITRQIFDTLISVKPGSTAPAPGLATSWAADPTGKVWTFRLRSNVTFSDGTPFDATSVCANLSRMYGQAPAGQAAAAYWSAFFGGFRSDVDKTSSLYRSCAATSMTTAVITIDHPTGRFPAMLAEPAFAMQSPQALTSGDANAIKQVGGGFSYPANAAHPVGTGPYVLERYDAGNGRVVLVRNPHYWGRRASTQRLVFRIIPDESARRQALEAGTVNGYDLPDPVDWAGLRAEGDQVELRDPDNLLYVGLGPAHNKLLTSLKVRQALYYALNRKRLVKAVLPDGTRAATQFVPTGVSGHNDTIASYAYSPAKAKQLLTAAHATGMKLTFAYPTGVSLPYLPDPVSVYDSLRTDLEAVGVKVTVVSAPWPEYQEAVRAGRYDAYLGGWAGDSADAYGPLGALFADPARGAFHTAGATWAKPLAAALQAADATVDPAARDGRFQALNAQIMTHYLPGLPIASSPSALVLDGTAKGLVPSAPGAESFAAATAAP